MQKLLNLMLFVMLDYGADHGDLIAALWLMVCMLLQAVARGACLALLCV
jgi:hypothetical protein